ncbi:MAG: pyridoxal phosphate-dependent aminotransferase, partial [Acidobacteriota bacterium]
MFSQRLKWDIEENRLSRLIAEKRRRGVPIFDLTESNPTRAGFEYPTEDILAAFQNDEAISYRPEPRGLNVARNAVANYYHACGIPVSSDRVHLTSSTSEGYAFLFKLLADPGSQVLVAQPSYPLFEFLAALDCVELRPYKLAYTHPRGWHIDFDSLESAITDSSRAVIVVNPNNPTGSYVTPEDRSRLSAVCARRNLAIIVDEVFADYS